MSNTIERRVIPVTPFQQNCSLVWCKLSGQAVVIDPGGDLELIEAAIGRAGVTVAKVLLTHAHLDHAAGARDLADRLGVAIEGPQEEDRFWLDLMPRQSQMYGFPPATAYTPDRWLVDDDEVTFGEQRMRVIHCPGHTPGHVVFHHADGVAFVGDVLFNGSVGRTDFPRGDHDALIDSIRRKLWPLGNDTVFVPGHGPESTFGFERRTNPYVGDRLFD